ncbi:hypothetical protein GCM10026982_00120 [Nocardiopsis aegyptia]
MNVRTFGPGQAVCGCDDGGATLRVFGIEHAPFPAQQPAELRVPTVIVVDPARVLADVLGGERLDRYGAGHLDEFVAQHAGEQLPPR